MDKLAKYKLDNAFTEGVCLYLDDASDVAFLVKLPSQYNRSYTQAVYGGMEFNVDQLGEMKTTGQILSTRYAQQDAFIDYCVISMDGDPVPQGFFDEYPAALEELMSKASELAAKIEEDVSNSVKKSPSSSSGKGSGQVESVSIAS